MYLSKQASLKNNRLKSLPTPREGVRWSKSEDLVIMQSISIIEQAAILGRSYYAVAARREFLANPNKIKDRAKEWKDNNRERVKANQKEWYNNGSVAKRSGYHHWTKEEDKIVASGISAKDAAIATERSVGAVYERRKKLKVQGLM